MPHPLSHQLGRLVEERTGLSLYQFAQRIGANASGLYKIDRGERDSIDSATFDKIAGGLHMTPAELAAQLEGKASPTMHADPGLLHLISVWPELSDERRDSILTLSRKVPPIRRGGKPPKRRFIPPNARWGGKSMTTRARAHARPVAA